MPLRMQMRASGLIVPIDELKLENDPTGFVTLGDDIPYVIALNMGHDGNQPRLLQVDSQRNLKVTLAAGSTSGLVVPILDQTANRPINSAGNLADANPGIVSQAVGPNLFNNAAWDRARSASAANLAAQSGLGAALAAPPGQWSVQHSPATGAQATVTRAAGAAGVRHVCTGFGFGFSAGVAIVASSIIVNLRDGASGLGAILKSWIFDLPAAIIAPFGIEVSGCEIVGSAATAMTIEYTALLANLRQYVNLAGHDAS